MFIRQVHSDLDIFVTADLVSQLYQTSEQA